MLFLFLTGCENNSQAYSKTDICFDTAVTLTIYDSPSASDEVNSLLDELNRLMLSMKNQPLPIDRVEFENRAILFLCLTELKQLLINRKNAQMLRDNNFYKLK